MSNPNSLGPPLPYICRRTRRVADHPLHDGNCLWTAVLDDTSVQCVPPKHLYPLAYRQEIIGMVILGLLVVQDLIVFWSRSSGSVRSVRDMVLSGVIRGCDTR